MPTTLILLTLVSAVLYALSFPPFSLWPLAWIALVPFLVVLTRVRPAVAFGEGMLWGVAMTGFFGWSFPELVANYFGVSRLLGWGCFLLVSVGLFGIYFAAFACWTSWLADRRMAYPVLIAAGWSVCEFARANLLWGNPLALLSYSQVSLTRLMQIADITGPYGAGMLITAVNACVAGYFAVSLRGRRFLPSCAFVGAAVVGVLVYGEWRLAQTFTTGDPIPVAVVQGAIDRKIRWDPEHREENLGRYLALTKEIALAQPRLIFWPENAVDFYLQEEVPESEAIFTAARDLGVNLILGGPSYGYGVRDIYYHNSVFLVRRGKLAGRYDKIRLLPFAETDQFRGFFAGKLLNLKPGRRPRMLRVEGVQVGAFVCFEALHPDLVRAFAMQGAGIFVNPSNDDWFGYAAPARHLLDIASVRAIENRRYLVRPTATGYSAVIDPHGRTVVRSSFGVSEVLTAAVSPSRTRTPYQQWGDRFVWFTIALATVASLFCIEWRGKKKQTNVEGGRL